MSAFLDAIRRFFYPFGVAFLGRGEVAEHPDEYAAGVRIYLTDEQVAAAIADLEQHFPKTKDRRIR